MNWESSLPIAAASTSAARAAGVLTGARATSGDANALARQFEAMLFADALRPLATALGFYGEIVTGELAASIARRSHDGLADALERSLRRDEP
jgi:hypothetical protein